MLSRVTLLLLFTAVSCADQVKLIDYRKTSKRELQSQIGEPTKVENPLPSVEVLTYENDQKYQVQADVVTAGFRKPTEEEKSLLHWRHTLRDCQTTFTELSKPKDSHLMAEKQLSCPELGVSVIYDPNVDQVTRVVDHAKN